MHRQDEYDLHKRIEAWAKEVPKNREGARDQLQAILSEKARKMDRRSMARSRLTIVANVSVLLLAVGGSLSLFWQWHERQQPVPSSAASIPAARELMKREDAEEAKDVTRKTALPQQSVVPPDVKAPVPTTNDPQAADEPLKQTVAQETAQPQSVAPADDDAARARAYLRQQAGAQSESYQLVEALSDRRQKRYMFAQTVKGVPVLDDRYTVQLSQGGEGQSVTAGLRTDRTFDLRLYPAPQQAIPRQEAEAALSQAMQRYLQAEADGPHAVGYDPAELGYFDALEGRWIGGNQAFADYRGKHMSVKPGGNNLTAKTQDQAKSLLGNAFAITVTGKVQKAHDSKAGTVEYRWRTEANGTAVMRTNEETGTVNRFAVTGETAASGQRELVADDALRRAAAFLETYLASDVDGLIVDKLERREAAYRIECRETAPEPLIGRAYTVDIDAFSGAVIGFSGDFAAERAKRAAALPPKEAVRAYLAAHPVGLAYVWPKGAAAPALVYIPMDQDLLH